MMAEENLSKFSASDLKSLQHLSGLLYLFHHRNKNQHRRSIWWRHFSTFRRQLNNLVSEVQSLHEVPTTHLQRSKKKAQDLETKDLVSKRIEFWIDVLVPKWHSTFSQIVTDGRFAVLGLVLIAVLAQACQITGINAGFNEAEVALIEEGRSRASNTTSFSPLRAFARSRSAWALCLQWFCHNYGFYFYLTWLPIYLQQARGLNIKTSALLAGMPLLFAGFGTLSGGFVVPKLSRAIGTARARRAMAYASYGSAAFLLLVFTFIKNPTAAIVVMSFSSFAVEVSTPVTWITAVDLGGGSVGTLTGAMNSLGQIGASVSPAVIGYVLTVSRNNWTLTFYLSAVIYALGIGFWAVLDPVKALDQHGAQ